MNTTNVFSWVLIVLGALFTYLVKPLVLRKLAADEEAQQKQYKLIYILKIVGMWLVIIGAVMIFIAGGMYGRH